MTGRGSASLQAALAGGPAKAARGGGGGGMDVDVGAGGSVDAGNDQAWQQLLEKDQEFVWRPS